MFFFSVGPILGLFLMLLLWMFFSHFFLVTISFLGLIIFFCLMRLEVYFLIFRGWSSNCSYTIIGAYRSVAQMVSYEVSLIVFVLIYAIFLGLYNLIDFWYLQHNFWFGVFLFHVFFCWLFVCLAERNRTPFDFSEGESELVSGFNVEYGGGFFSLIFICEYGILILLGWFSSIIFCGGGLVIFKIICFSVFFCLDSWCSTPISLWYFDTECLKVISSFFFGRS